MTTLDDDYEEIKVNSSHEVSNDDNLFLLQLPKDFSLDSLHGLKIPLNRFLEKEENNSNNDHDQILKRITADYLNYNLIIKNNKKNNPSSSSSSPSRGNDSNNNLEVDPSNMLRAIKYDSENGKNKVSKPFKGVITIVRDILDVQDKNKDKNDKSDHEDFTSETFKSQLIDNYGKRQQLTGLSLSNIPFGSESSLKDIRKRKRSVVATDNTLNTNTNTSDGKSLEKKSKKEKKEKKSK